MAEIWVDIKDYEGFYQVSNLGRVRSLPRWVKGKGKSIQLRDGFYLKVDIAKGYERVTLFKNNNRKRVMVHRLVAQHFVDNPKNKPEVNHIDGNKRNNKLTNLEWVTSSENQLHAFKTGLQKPTKSNKRLEYSDVCRIREMLDEGMKQTKIAKIFDVYPSTISSIKTGKYWKKGRDLSNV